MKRSTLVFSILGVLLLMGGLGVGVYLVRQNQNFAEKAAPATSVYVMPGSQSKNPGDSFTFSVDINTATNAVTGIDIEMTFDPNTVQIVSLTKGSGAANLDQTIKNTFDNSTGTISYAIFTLNTSNALTGSGIAVLTVNATVKSGATAGNYNLAFDPATSASATQEGQNVLVSKTQGVLTVQGAAGTPTPSGSATPTPSGAPTPTPSGSGTPGPTHSPTPNPSPTGTGGTGSVNVTSPASGSTVSDNTPTFKGTAPAGSTVTVTIYSTPVTVTVTADANGNWQYTPSQSLTDGSHTITVTASGTTKTASSSFTVQTGGMTLPVTGIEWPTITAGAVGIIIIIGSILLAI